jgi:hypothetical protein
MDHTIIIFAIKLCIVAADVALLAYEVWHRTH